MNTSWLHELRGRGTSLFPFPHKFTEPKDPPLFPFLFTAKRDVCPICKVSQLLCNEASSDATSFSAGHCQGTRGCPSTPQDHISHHSPSPGKVLHYSALLFAGDLPNFSKTVHLFWPILATFWVINFEWHRAYFLSHFLNLLALRHCYPPPNHMEISFPLLSFSSLFLTPCPGKATSISETERAGLLCIPGCQGSPVCFWHIRSGIPQEQNFSIPYRQRLSLQEGFSNACHDHWFLYNTW